MTPRRPAPRAFVSSLARALAPVFAPALALVVALALPACDSLLVPDPRPSTPVQIFDQVWSDFDRYYAHFDISGVDWNAVRDRFRPQAEHAIDEAALARAIAGMLIELHDPHVTLYTPWAEYQDWSSYRPGAYEGSLLSRYLTTTPTPSGKILYGRIGGDVGYIRIASFEGDGWGSEVDEALGALTGVRGIVVDVRCNSGGLDATAKSVAQRFVDHEGVAEYVAFRAGAGHEDFGPPVAVTIAPAGTSFSGRVALLTDRGIFSAAEQFVLFMRLAAHLTVVGDTTGGASGRPISRELPNGWSYRLSTWVLYTAAHERYEGIGLPPDLVVRPQPGDAARGIDRVLEAAMAAVR